jgi:hypothetical protein
MSAVSTQISNEVVNEKTATEAANLIQPGNGMVKVGYIEQELLDRLKVALENFIDNHMDMTKIDLETFIKTHLDTKKDYRIPQDYPSKNKWSAFLSEANSSPTTNSRRQVCIDLGKKFNALMLKENIATDTKELLKAGLEIFAVLSNIQAFESVIEKTLADNKMSADISDILVGLKENYNGFIQLMLASIETITKLKGKDGAEFKVLKEAVAALKDEAKTISELRILMQIEKEGNSKKPAAPANAASSTAIPMLFGWISYIMQSPGKKQDGGLGDQQKLEKALKKPSNLTPANF